MALQDKDDRSEIIKILCLCILWYTVSSGNNIVGKLLLSEFPYPMSVTMVQLVSITFYCGPVLKILGVRRQAEISWDYYKMIVLPLAFGKFLASVFSHVSLWKVPVSYVHTGEFTVQLVMLCMTLLSVGNTFLMDFLNFLDTM